MSAYYYSTLHDDKGIRRRARWILRIVLLGLALLIAWASVGRIDQVTRANGQIIATARTQVVQAADGGVLTELHVQEGAEVKGGQLLATFEKGRAQAAVSDSRGKVAALQITLARLRAEVYGSPLIFDSEVSEYKEFVANQTALFNKRKTAIDQDVAALNRHLLLAREELQMNEQLEKSGDVSRADLLRLRRQVAEIEAQISAKRNKYFQDAQAEMTKAQEDLNTQMESLRDRTQLMQHTELTAPVTGIVKNIRMTTLGGVVRAGDVVLEILPTGGDLIVEAKLSPADIAFVNVGDPAQVKLEAFDSTVYGALVGKVAYVSADTLTDETPKGPVPYYRIHVRLEPRIDKRPIFGQGIQVRPGMTCSVEIKAMDRTVLSYLSKPVIKTMQNSLGER